MIFTLENYPQNKTQKFLYLFQADFGNSKSQRWHPTCYLERLGGVLWKKNHSHPSGFNRRLWHGFHQPVSKTIRFNFQAVRILLLKFKMEAMKRVSIKSGNTKSSFVFEEGLHEQKKSGYCGYRQPHAFDHLRNLMHRFARWLSKNPSDILPERSRRSFLCLS